MTNEKLLEVIDRYTMELPDVIHGKVLASDARTKEVEALVHLMEMFPQMREFIKSGRREKLMRWLGWVQGVLFMCDVYTLDEMKTHNMPSS